MNANYFVRSSPDFSSRDDNKVGVLTRGTRFEVLRSISMSGGAEALEIHVTGLARHGNLQVAKSYWVYKSKNSHFVQLNKNTRETQAGSTDLPCKDCGQVQEPTGNTRDLGDVSTTITRQDNEVDDEDDQPTNPNAPILPGRLDRQIKNYSSSDAVEYSINFALRNKFSHSHSRCYRKVKDALAAHAPGKRGLIPRWYSGVAARTGRDALKSYGFLNLLETEPYKTQIKKPSQAPKGAVLVYSSGVPCRGTRIPDCGHIEIKTGRPGNNAYVSDYSYPTGINETPAALRFGSHYKLIGVMIKPTN